MAEMSKGVRVLDRNFLDSEFEDDFFDTADSSMRVNTKRDTLLAIEPEGDVPSNDRMWGVGVSGTDYLINHRSRPDLITEVVPVADPGPCPVCEVGPKLCDALAALVEHDDVQGALIFLKQHFPKLAVTSVVETHFNHALKGNAQMLRMTDKLIAVNYTMAVDASVNWAMDVTANGVQFRAVNANSIKAMGMAINNFKGLIQTKIQLEKHMLGSHRGSKK
nr:hypothetical protein [Salmonid herpesvirus 1]